MAKLEKYRNYVQQLIEQYGNYKPSYGEIEVQTIFDTEHDHYQLINVGWHDQQRIRGCVLQIDIKDEKIWIQHDGTEIGVANELVALGVPKEDIVLAFHAPYKRKYTGFSAN
ncbi:MAG: XisI protein [bacterium]